MRCPHVREYCKVLILINDCAGFSHRNRHFCKLRPCKIFVWSEAPVRISVYNAESLQYRNIFFCFCIRDIAEFCAGRHRHNPKCHTDSQYNSNHFPFHTYSPFILHEAQPPAAVLTLSTRDKFRILPQSKQKTMQHQHLSTCLAR